jgi:hypothetical protein
MMMIHQKKEQPGKELPQERESNNKLDDFHSDDPILDLVHIEYQNCIIYKREPNQTEEQLDADLQQGAMGATCMVSHQRHPLVCPEYFMAPSDGTMIYYYILYTCQTLVEQDTASGQMSDDDEDFDPQRFFSMRIIQDDTHQEEEGSDVVDNEGNTHTIHEPEEPHIIHYLNDSIKVNTTRTILDFNEEESNHILEEHWDTLCSNIP